MNSKLLIAQAALALTLTGCGGSSGGDSGTTLEVATGGDTTTDDGSTSLDTTGDDGAADNGSNTVEDADSSGDSTDVNGSSTDSSTSVGGNFNLTGTVTASGSADAGIFLFAGNFTSVQGGFTMQEAIDEITSESCVVNDEEEEDDFVETDISAGEALIVSSAQGTVATITRFTSEFDASIISYFSEVINGVLPTGLVLDIPGDDFPSFSNVTIPTTQPVILSTPSSGTVFTAGDQVVWNAGNSSNLSLMSINMNFTDGTEIECETADDGSFTLPPSVLSQLGTDLQAEEISIARVESIFTPQNDALLLTSGVTGFSISF